MFHCFNCQTPWKSTLRQPAVKETCGHCGAYLHCCKNCRFHQKGYPNECYIPDTEKIADKRRANFCDEFEFRSASTASSEGHPSHDRLANLWGDDVEKTRSQNEPDRIKDWILESDTAVKDFEDLFDD